MISIIIQSIILSIFYIYYFSRIIEIEIDYKKARYYIGLIILIISFVVINMFNIRVIRLPLNMLAMFLVMNYIFKPKIEKSIISIFLIYLISSISEIILSMLLVMLNYSFSNIGYFQNLLLNLIIMFVSICIFNLKQFNKWKKMLFDSGEKLKKYIISFLLIIFFCLLITYLYDKLDTKLLILYIDILIIIMFFLIIIITIKDSSKQKISNDYDNMLTYLKEYELLLEEQFKKNHEYKNQLVVIMSMIDDEKTKSYISRLIGIKMKIDSDLLSDLNKIQIPGIKGLLYYKFSLALKNNIDIKLDIGINFKEMSKFNLLQNEIEDLTKLIGIFMDNAIEAVLALDKKQISVSFYINEKEELVISIANNFDNSINVEKVIKNKFTTKGKNHGYGLLLANDIVNKNKKIINNREIISNVFIQNIIYKIKD